MSPGLTRILLALTFVTGIVDAVTFLAGLAYLRATMTAPGRAGAG